MRVLRILEVPVAVIVLGMMFLVTANGVGRRLFGLQIPATLELSQYWFMPLIALIGIVVAHMRGEHIVADLFYSGFPDALKKGLTITTNVVIVLVLAGFTYFSASEAIDAMDHGVKAGATQIPAWPAAFIAPLAMGAFAALLIVDTIRMARMPVSAFATDLDAEAAEEMAALEDAAIVSPQSEEPTGSSAVHDPQKGQRR
jgi:TRAP-type C4-dicarboxylate transport system permease small subunit